MSARLPLLLLSVLLPGAAAAGQVREGGLAARVAAAPDGQVRFSYAARPGVMGNGRNVISWDCHGHRCNSNRVRDRDDFDSEWRSDCDSGPVRVALRVRGGRPTSLHVYVGGDWAAAGSSVTDLGTVPVADATRYLLGVAATSRDEAGREAVFAATLADRVVLWPELLRLAKTDELPRETRRTAVFWLGQAAGEAATKGLDDLLAADDVDRDVQKAAVFALSQRPRDEGVPTLIRVAKSHRDPEIRRQAIFWLGQSDDPRALALFEELLTGP